ncbi:acetolactate synthase [Blattabacterium cuenoti]|uniref:acetolactate synthase n=1 Tax=Blattabacterium cuenoti TaxID=1653831 RepID=UPI00163CE488|nr:acetolactate synthase [Blattabacterium cuenoti]
MKHKFRIIILGENDTRLLSRILIILNRRNLKTNHINVYNDKNSSNFQHLLDLESKEEELIKIKKLIDKLIGVIHVNYYKIEEKNSRKNSWKRIDLPLATSQ